MLVGRLPNLQLGHFTLTDPVVHFAQDQKGAFASSDFSGVIGGELLRRFKVIFDYAHKQMILEIRTKVHDSKGKERKLVVRARSGYYMKMQDCAR